jgi:hypothetical protein
MMMVETINPRIEEVAGCESEMRLQAVPMTANPKHQAQQRHWM